MLEKPTVRGVLAGAPAELRQELERALKMLAHDLRTPLATITMDVYSAQLIVSNLTREGQALPRESLSNLTEICVNLEQAAAKLGAQIDALTEGPPGDET
jgi:signal transduction histidine kinase